MNDQLTATAGRTVTWQGTSYKILLPASVTGGNLAVFEALTAPNQGPPRHVHHAEDEVFYILSGEVTFWLDGDTFTRGPGDLVFVPRGKPHTFVVGPDPARWITALTPGGMEGFFVEMAAGNYAIPQHMADVARIAASYAMEFVGPPLSP